MNEHESPSRLPQIALAAIAVILVAVAGLAAGTSLRGRDADDDPVLEPAATVEQEPATTSPPVTAPTAPAPAAAYVEGVVEHGRAVCAELDPSMPLWEMNGCDLFTAD